MGAKRNGPSAIDLFCGAGGMSLGLRQAGFRVAAALDVSPVAVESYRLNFPRTLAETRDARGADGERLLRLAGLRGGELDLLAGGPPCQGFSALRAGRRRTADDERNGLVLELARLAGEMLPRFVLMENVPGLADAAVFGECAARLEGLGYGVVSGVLDSAGFGVPQRRRRLVLAAARGARPRLAAGNGAARTVREAIGAIAAAAGRSGDPLHDHGETRAPHVRSVIEAIPPDGGSRADLGADAQLACHRRAWARGDGCGRDSYARMAWDRPAPTITGGCVSPGKGRFLHPEEHRAITVREALLLQGFPPDYRLSLKRGKYAAAELAGNAVPPALAKAQAAELLRTAA